MSDRKILTAKILSIVVLAALLLLSVTVISDHLSSPEFHAETIRVLDAQKQEALTLSIAVTAASTALSMCPDDAASPIANELADLSLPLFLIVSIIYLEMFLLTTFGWLSSTFLFPAACLLMIGYVLSLREYLLVWIKKILILALALIMLIPVSTKITSQIEETFSETVHQKLQAAFHIANAAETKDQEETNAILSFFSSLADNVVSLVDTARNMLSIFVDAITILFITSCVIPLLTLFLFLQVIKLVLNADIPTRKLALLVSPTKRERRSLEKAQEPGQ